MANPTPQSLAAPYADAFERVAGDLPGAGTPWIDALRRGAAERLRLEGFPHRKTEAWKYTDVRRVVQTVFEPAAADDRPLPADLAADLADTIGEEPAAVFVNGRFRADLSRLDGLGKGVHVSTLAEGLARDDGLLSSHLGQLMAIDGMPFARLNTALMADGLVLRVDRGAEAAATLHLVSITLPVVDDGEAVPTAAYPRHLIVAGANSRAKLVETHLGGGEGGMLAAGLTEVSVGEGARLAHYRHQADSASATNIAAALVRLSKDAVYESFALTTGAELSRYEAHAVLDGPGADCRISGAYLVDGNRHADLTTVITHAQPDGRSRQVFKGVLDDQARAAFQGRIEVAREAQRTDGHQLNKALLLSPKAEIDAKPELEIFADDVKCSHGATAGRLDPQGLFYLRSRGIDEAVARRLLVEAFVQDAIDEIEDEAVRARYHAAVSRRLGGGEAATLSASEETAA